MAIQKTIQVGNPKLKAKNKNISDFNDPKLKQLIADLVDTMHDVGLIGIAAPQIGENYLIFVTEPRETKTRPKDQVDQLRIYINPKIIEKSDEEIIIYEGCGSVVSGQLFGPVLRSKTITVEAFDEKGKKFRFSADGILGRVIQHEFDHINGIEFIEKVSDYQKLKTLEHYIEQIKTNPEHIKASTITHKKHEYLRK